jgi:hydrogenase nickel incorporation protein HypA/HybF
MHEYSIVQALVQLVERQASAHGAVRVNRVWVRIGDLSGVDPGLLAIAYDTSRAGTVCRDAPLQVTAVAAQWVCGACDAPVAGGRSLRCGTCGGPARLARGDEILLERIEMEVGSCA